MSTENIYQATISTIEKNLPNVVSLSHLDIGSGSGKLIKKMRGLEHEIISSACDYTDTLMALKDQKVDIVDLNKTGLPYDDETFDIVTATEIIEHLENPRSFMRDIGRILKPGGICVISTPNVLNLNSRLRYLWFGFTELFGPLSLKARKNESCSGHISPISYFYLYHTMRESGFNHIALDVDKYQRSGMAKLALLYLPIKIKEKIIKRKESSKYKTIDKTNVEIVNKINSKKILLGRTIIVTGKKYDLWVNKVGFFADCSKTNPLLRPLSLSKNSKSAVLGSVSS